MIVKAHQPFDCLIIELLEAFPVEFVKLAKGGL